MRRRHVNCVVEKDQGRCVCKREPEPVAGYEIIGTEMALKGTQRASGQSELLQRRGATSYIQRGEERVTCEKRAAVIEALSINP